ncbi:glutathione S-transferase, partial [Bacillus thuringiensis]|nr:glutathione S-transferase [Bacillus thuringiensis]
MKLIGSYISFFVCKILVILLEKCILFEFVNEFFYSESNGVVCYNLLGKVLV